MANRKFLVDIDLNKNQLLNPLFQILASAPGTPTEGQFYYNSTDETVYARTSIGWLDLGQQGVSDGAYGDITVSASGATWTINNDAVTYDKIQNVVGNNVFIGNVSGAGSSVEELSGTQATSLLDIFTSGLKGLVPASGGGTTTFLRADGTFATPAGGFSDFSGGADTGADETVDSGDLFEVIGGTGLETAIAKAGTTVSITVILSDTAVTPGSYGLTGSIPQITIDQQGRITSASNVAIGITESQITNLGTAITLNADTDVSGNGWVIDEDNMISDDDTKVPTQQSVKAYVDNAVAGGVSYKGAYNASTNTPDLDITPSGVEIGDMYTVTAAGQFFTANVSIGDVLIAEVDNAATEADWTIVEKNIDDIVPASETDAGIIEIATQAETDAGTDDVRAVTPLKLHTFLGTDDPDLNSAVSYTEQIGDGVATSITVTHDIGRQFVNTEIYETAAPFNQVEACVQATSATQTTFVFNTAPASNEYTVAITG